MEKLNAKLKNIVVVLVSIAIIMGGALQVKIWLVNQMTEYTEVSLTK